MSTLSTYEHILILQFSNLFSIDFPFENWLQLLFRIYLAIAVSIWRSLLPCGCWAALPRWRTPTFADCMCTVDGTRHQTSQNDGDMKVVTYEHDMNMILL